MRNVEVKTNAAGSYCRFSDCVLMDETGTPALPKIAFIHQQFRALMMSDGFPCVGAKSAFQRNTYRFGTFGPLGGVETTDVLLGALRRYVEEQPVIDEQFATFVATFDGPTIDSEETFERQLWSQLQDLAQKDARANAWAADASSDPNDPDFAFSIGGHSYFIVGLSPAASRWSRRFAWPTLVFNAHDQFNRLKTAGRFERMQKVIRVRDIGLQGGINPQLADFGTQSEARQYSGRQTSPDWRCPVHFPSHKLTVI